MEFSFIIIELIINVLCFKTKACKKEKVRLKA